MSVESFTGGGNRTINLSTVRFRNLSEDISCRRIDGVEELGPFEPLAIDQELTALNFRFRCCQHSAFVVIKLKTRSFTREPSRLLIRAIMVISP